MNSIIYYLNIVIIVGGMIAVIPYFFSKYRGTDRLIEQQNVASMKDLLHNRDLQIEILNGEIKKLNADIDGQKVLNQQLLSNPVNRDILQKMEESITQLNIAMARFLPLIAPGGFIEKVDQDNQTIIRQIEDIHGTIVKKKNKAEK